MRTFHTGFSGAVSDEIRALLKGRFFIKVAVRKISTAYGQIALLTETRESFIYNACHKSDTISRSA
jgi:hypothetical protein